MNNIYLPKLAKVTLVSRESSDTVLLRFKFSASADQKAFAFLPGQFMQIGLAGWGECPISICSSPADSSKFFELAIRDVGPLTHHLNELKVGAKVYVRGPFGNGFPIDNYNGKKLVLIGGGCGFVPLRPLILDYLAGRLKASSMQIFYGCLNEETILFKNEQPNWNKKAKVSVILDKPSAKWKGEQGMITVLIKKNKITPDSVAVMVGPPVMYKFAIKELLAKKIKPENIHLSLERKMYCGLGVCQHCAIGPYYVCKDGPVFTYTQLKDIPNSI
jgi:sulfhydrogenase subunit gamma (sulfur reductase)